MQPALSFDDVPNGVVVVEDGGGIVSANVAMLELLGCDAAWLIGKPFSAVLTRPAAMLYHASIYMEVRGRGRVQETYLDLKNQAGDAVPVLCSALLRQQGDRALIVLSATRMTERRRMEDDLLRTRRITEQIPGAVYQYVLKADGTHCIPYASEALRQMFGVSPASVQQSAAPLLAALHPDDRAGFRDSVLLSAASLQTWRHHFRAQRLGGPYRWLEGHATPHRLPDGSTVWHGFMQDVTERIALEEAMREKEAADRANHAKSSFLARVSHELRTPLNAILGFSQILGRDRQHPLAPVQQRRVQHIHDAGRDLLQLIDEVLDITGIEAGAMRLRPEWSALAPLLTGVARLVEEPARKRGLQIQLQVDTDLSALVDAARLRQVLTNLLSNAVKYTADGSAVTVSCGVQADSLVIAVHDAGPGMSADQLEHLFEPFNRLGAERTEVQGTGLGLVIVKRVVEAMGGSIGVRSSAAEGTTFQVVLPYVPTPAAASAPASSSAAETAVGTAHGTTSTHQPAATSTVVPFLSRAAGADRTLRVLYVEDNPVNAIVMESICALQPGLALHIEKTGQGGLDWLQRHPADLLLVDMGLPDMHGLELLSRIRRLDGCDAVEAIAVSADAMPELVQKARLAGIETYWTKPLDVDATLVQLRLRLQALPVRRPGSANGDPRVWPAAPGAPRQPVGDTG